MSTTLREDVSVELEPAARADESARLILGALNDEMRANESDILLDEDPRALHRFRIAVRRTRTITGELESVFEPIVHDRFVPDFKWLARLTGPVRDLDVFTAQVEALSEDLDDADRRQLKPVFDMIEADRKEEFAVLEEGLKSEQYRSLMSDWNTHLQGSTPSDDPPPDASTLTMTVATRAIWKVFNKVVSRGEKVLAMPDLPAPNVHKLRISCKKLRYLIEAFESLFDPNRLEPIVKDLRAIQTDLGDFHDLAVQRARLDGYRGRLEGADGPNQADEAIRHVDEHLKDAFEKSKGSLPGTIRDIIDADSRDRFEVLLGPADDTPEADAPEVGRRHASVASAD